MNTDLQALADCVRHTAQRVIAERRDLAVSVKDDGSLVTSLDEALQLALSEALQSLLPGIPVLGEEMDESSQARIAGGERFISLDPLDGTSNFVSGIPFYAVSLAVVERGQARQAVTFDPTRDECFSAMRGQGAWLNGESIVGAARACSLAKSIAVVDNKRLKPAEVEALVMNRPFHSVRNFGSVALEWAWLAAGRIDYYVHGGQKLWDRIPGQLICREAGGDWARLYSPANDAPLTSVGRVAAARADQLDALLSLDTLRPHVRVETPAE